LRVPDIHIRGPEEIGLPATGPVVICGIPNDAEVDAARQRAAQDHPGKPILYVIADNAATLVLMSTLWQLGITPPNVKLRGPAPGTPVIIYGVPDEGEIGQREADARTRWPHVDAGHFVSDSAANVVLLQWVWQSG
jgi:hypothetical protein